VVEETHVQTRLSGGQKREIHMLKLYHGTTSVCAAKVRLVLYEKGMSFESELLNLQQGDQHKPDYLKLNPKAVVPTLVDGERVITESSVIMFYLGKIQPEPPLMPGEPWRRALARLWMKRVDEFLHPGCTTVTFATTNRKYFLATMTAEEREARYPATPIPNVVPFSATVSNSGWMHPESAASSNSMTEPSPTWNASSTIRNGCRAAISVSPIPA
jgi:hypothetical protein